MADTTTSISGPITIADSSRERVAFDMMKLLQGASEQRQDQLLELYAKCLLISMNPSMGLERVKQAVKG